MQKIIVYGTILFDHINEDYFIGGCHTNVAAHCAKLGMDTTMVSSVGTDGLGEKAINWMKSIGIRTEYIAKDEIHSTGRVEVDVTDPQNPQYDLLDNVAYDFIQLSEEKMQSLAEEQYDFLYFGTVEQRHEMSTQTLHTLLDRLNVRYVFFDINLRKDCYTVPKIIESLKKTDILKVNEEELIFLAESILKKNVNEETLVKDLMKQYSIQLIIVTRSGKGASVYYESKKLDVEAVKNEVVDSVGAGDAFSAAFISCFARTGNVEAAMKAGTTLGSYVVGNRSAVPEYTDDILEKMRVYGI